MATIKSYTDLEQSKKLAKVLPLESADMSWVSCDDGKQKYYQAENRKIILNYEKNHWLPCWSLAALLYVIPERIIKNYYAPNLQKENGKYSIAYGDDELLCIADNPVDACVAIIEKLNELNLL